jgi:hypothetical protein
MLQFNPALQAGRVRRGIALSALVAIEHIGQNTPITAHGLLSGQLDQIFTRSTADGLSQLLLRDSLNRIAMRTLQRTVTHLISPLTSKIPVKS